MPLRRPEFALGSAVARRGRVLGPIPGNWPNMGPGFAYAVSADATSVTTPPVNTIGLNLFIVAISYVSGAGSISVTDSASNTYSDIDIVENSSRAVAIYFSSGATPSASHTFTVTGSGAGVSPSVAVISRRSTAGSPQDTSTSAVSSGNVTSLQPGALTPAGAGELMVAALMNIGTGRVYTIDSGFQLFTVSPPTNPVLNIAVLNSSGAAALNPTWGMSPASTSATILAAFKYA